MTKSKSGGLARLPKDQKSHFLIGPVASWFMPNATDLWTHDAMPNLSYLVYGSIGCLCYGEIHHQPKLGATVNNLIDVKDDNSRVACVRFLKGFHRPLILAITESGSLIIHDCFKKENLVHFKKAEVLTKCLGPDVTVGFEQGAKRTKFEVTQQINSCSWPKEDTILLGVTLLRDKRCFVLKLKLENNNIKEHHKIDLDLLPYPSPICLVESAMLDEKVCAIAVGMEDGVITVVLSELDTNKSIRTIKFERHHDQICALSLSMNLTKDCPLGMLASVSRDGLVRISNIDRGSYFAIHQAAHNVDRESNSKIDWFSLRFIEIEGVKRSYVAVTNVESGISLLEVPEDVNKTKARLKPVNAESKFRNAQTLKHNKLIFNIEYDPLSETIITSSLDGNHILWSVQRTEAAKALINLQPQFLYPAMLNNARVHMLRHNPIKEDLMCLALGKGGVKFYQISENMADSKFDMTPSCELVSRKLSRTTVTPTSIAWHPNHEYRVAIGTIEGKVFRADITPRKAALIEGTSSRPSAPSPYDDALGVEYQPMVRMDEQGCSKNGSDTSKQQQRSDGVYSLCWGPNPASPQDVSKHAIYAVGSVSHRLSIFCSTTKENCDKLTNYLDEFHDKSLPEALGQASEVAWKSSMDLMALGTIDGRIIVATYLDESHQERSHNKLFKVLTTIKGPLGNVFVQCLAWHPTTDDGDGNYYKLVASSNESAAYVFNLKEAILVADVRERLKLGQADGDQSAPNMLSAFVNKLDAHQKAISDIAWNPHQPNQLATCSFDRTCIVWSLDNCLMDAQKIAKFSARDRLFTLEWSLVDEDLVYTSGNDSIIWAWRPSENRAPHGSSGDALPSARAHSAT